MKKRLLIFVLLLCSCLLFALGATACEKPTEGLLYEVSADGTYAQVTAYEGTSKKIVIADTYNGLPVKSIKQELFRGNEEITSVVIPDSVTEIGRFAFFNCGNLKKVSLGAGVASVGEYAFVRCKNLKGTVYGNAKYLGNGKNPYRLLLSAVNTERSSYKVHKKTKIIMENAFAECSKMTSFTIPDSVAVIGRGALNACSSLEELTIPFIGEKLNAVRQYPLGHIFGYVKYEGAMEVMQYSYDTSTRRGDNKIYCIPNSLKKVVVTGGTVYERAFENCSNLKSVRLPEGVTELREGTFLGCSSLTDFIIPSGITAIGDRAFSGCCSLANLTIPEKVTTIGYLAFGNCSSLTEVVIPKAVVELRGGVFMGCKNLTSLIFVDAKGWSFGGLMVSEKELSNSATAAEYLTSLYIFNSKINKD